MTAKDQAESLVMIFEPHARIIVNPGEKVGREVHAKICAVLAVEQIMQAEDRIGGIKNTVRAERKKYWQTVKQEIEKI